MSFVLAEIEAVFTAPLLITLGKDLYSSKPESFWKPYRMSNSCPLFSKILEKQKRTFSQITTDVNIPLSIYFHLFNIMSESSKLGTA